MRNLIRHTIATVLFFFSLAAVLAFASAARSETTTDRLHAVLLKLPPWHGAKDDPARGDVSEDPILREARLLSIATAITSGVQHTMCIGPWKVEGCQRRWRGSGTQLAAALASIGYWETAFASAIHLNRCDLLPGGCDKDRMGIPRARSYWQCWKSACPELWQTEVGTEAELRTAAWEASKLLAGFYGYCKTLGDEDPWELAFTAYAGRGCKPWDVAKRRRATMTRILSKL
jgi:hypothetical protein